MNDGTVCTNRCRTGCDDWSNDDAFVGDSHNLAKDLYTFTDLVVDLLTLLEVIRTLLRNEFKHVTTLYTKV